MNSEEYLGRLGSVPIKVDDHWNCVHCNCSHILYENAFDCCYFGHHIDSHEVEKYGRLIAKEIFEELQDYLALAHIDKCDCSYCVSLRELENKWCKE